MKLLGLSPNLSTKKTRKRQFLAETERVVPWAVLVRSWRRTTQRPKGVAAGTGLLATTP